MCIKWMASRPGVFPLIFVSIMPNINQIVFRADRLKSTCRRLPCIRVSSKFVKTNVRYAVKVTTDDVVVINRNKIVEIEKKAFLSLSVDGA